MQKFTRKKKIKGGATSGKARRVCYPKKNKGKARYKIVAAKKSKPATTQGKRANKARRIIGKLKNGIDKARAETKRQRPKAGIVYPRLAKGKPQKIYLKIFEKSIDKIVSGMV